MTLTHNCATFRTIAVLEVGVNHGFGRLDITHAIDCNFKAEEGLYEARSVWEVRAVVYPDWVIGEAGNGISFEEVVKDSV